MAVDRGVDAALDLVGVGAGGDVLEALGEDRLGVDGGGGGAVAGVLGGLAGDLLDHLGAHVLLVEQRGCSLGWDFGELGASVALEVVLELLDGHVSLAYPNNHSRRSLLTLAAAGQDEHNTKSEGRRQSYGSGLQHVVLSARRRLGR